MRVTDFTRKCLAARRQDRDLTARGYEEVGERGGNLWELHRGARTNYRIVDAIIAVQGKSIYVKCEPKRRDTPVKD